MVNRDYIHSSAANYRVDFFVASNVKRQYLTYHDIHWFARAVIDIIFKCKIVSKCLHVVSHSDPLPRFAALF